MLLNASCQPWVFSLLPLGCGKDGSICYYIILRVTHDTIRNQKGQDIQPTRNQKYGIGAKEMIACQSDYAGSDWLESQDNELENGN
jgi:hypothetical protein